MPLTEARADEFHATRIRLFLSALTSIVGAAALALDLTWGIAAVVVGVSYACAPHVRRWGLRWRRFRALREPLGVPPRERPSERMELIHVGSRLTLASAAQSIAGFRRTAGRLNVEFVGPAYFADEPIRIRLVTGPDSPRGAAAQLALRRVRESRTARLPFWEVRCVQLVPAARTGVAEDRRDVLVAEFVLPTASPATDLLALPGNHWELVALIDAEGADQKLVGVVPVTIHARRAPVSS